MTRHVRPPANTPRLLQVLGPDPIRLRIDGQLVPLADQGALTIRRSKPARKALGDPAALSVQVVCDTPPTWRDGAKVTVELESTALAALYGPKYLLSNYTANPTFGIDAASWSAAVGWSLVRSTNAAWSGSAGGRLTATSGRAANTDMLLSNRMGFGEVTEGQRWTGKLAIRPVANVSMLLRLELVAVDQLNTVLAVVARRDVAAAGGAWLATDVPSIATIPAGATGVRWRIITRDEVSSGVFVDFDGFVSHISATPPTIYFDGSTANFIEAGTGRSIVHSWDGTAHNSTSRRYVSGTPEKHVAARYRFVGRIAPNGVRLLTGRTGPAVAQVVATGTQAQLAMTAVGDVPWPAETTGTRAVRVLELAKAADPALSYTAEPPASGPTMAWRDVDRRPATELLEELAIARDPLAGLVERRDGSLTFGLISDATFPAVWLTDQVVPTQLEHEQAPRVNDVAVDLGAPPAGTLLRTNEIPNPGFELDTSGWTAVNGTLTRDTTFAYQNTSSGKVTPTAAGTNPGAYTSWVVAPGQRWRARLKLAASVAGNYKLYLAYYTPGAVAAGTDVSVPEFAVPAGLAWTELDATFAPIPAGVGIVRFYVYRVQAGATTAMTHWMDQVSAYDLAYPGADTAPGMDGNNTDTPQVVYSWTGTVNASKSTAVAGESASPIVLRYQDAASIAANGPASATVEAGVDLSSLPAAKAYADARGPAELLAGGWQAPAIEVDLLALLENPGGAVTATPAGTTRQELAGALVMAELGSTRTWRRAVGDAAHVPALHNVPARISGLDETITAHRWTVTTQAERTA